MKPWEFAVRRWQFTSIVFLFLIALGLYAIFSIPRQEDPSFPIPVTSIVVSFSGADPYDVERLVVDPIEDAIAELDEVKTILSSSEDGLAVLSVEFEWSVDADAKFDEVVREVSALRPRLPKEVGEILFRKENPNLVNIVQMALVSAHASPLELKQHAVRLEEVLETIPGVRRAESWAYPQPEVRVSLDLPRLVALGLNLDSVIGAVEGEGQAIPGGAVDLGNRRYNLKTSGDYASLKEVEETVLASRNGRLVRLRDVADIAWAAEEEVYVGRFNGQRAAFVTANMKDGGNIFAVQAAINERVQEFQATLPATMRLERGFEQSQNVARRLQGLAFDFLIALELVSITLLPLGFRAAGIVMVVIPLSLAMGVAGLWLLGFSLNQISIAGFVLALGLLVDDAIVVVENVARHLREGYGRIEAAIIGTKQIAPAVLGCTAALLFAFFPLLNLPEGAGKFTRSLPLAVVLTVLASLVVALTVVPFLASRLMPKDGTEGNWALRQVQRSIQRVYGPLVRASLARPKLALVLSFTLVGMSLLIIPKIGFALFPAADKPEFLIAIRAPEEASLAATDRALRFVEEQLASEPAVAYAMSNLGKGNPFVYYNLLPRETRANTAEVLVGLAQWDPRESPALIESLRRRFAEYPDAQIVINRFRNGPPIEAPIAIRILGPELEQLRTLALEVEQTLKSTRGTRDVTNPVRWLRMDLDLGLDLNKAGLLGVASEDLDRGVRLAVAGYPVTQYRDQNGDQYNVTLRVPMAQRPTAEALDYVYFTSRTSGAAIPLMQLASPHFISGPNQVRHYNRERVVTITADVLPGYLASQVTEEIFKVLNAKQLPQGYRLMAGGEAQASTQSLRGLGLATLVAIGGILAVLVLEFGSFRAMLITLGVIPFGILGGLVALPMSGYSLSFMAILGFIALIGVEIKNSILLVDFTNQLRKQGLPLDDAIATAGELRFLPVLLTSVTAIGGLIPLAIAGSALYSPLAVVMIGGLITSTLFTRIVTPVMYRLLAPRIEVKGI